MTTTTTGNENNMDTVHTFQRTDGKPIYPKSVFGVDTEFESETLRTEYLQTVPAFDGMETVYEIKADGTTMPLRHRIRRLGAPDPCDGGSCLGCGDCDGGGVKRRDDNPAWIEKPCSLCGGTERVYYDGWNVCFCTDTWQIRYESEFGEPPNRPRAQITDEITQDNVNDYTWQERFEHENGRPVNASEIAERKDMIDRIFGTGRYAKDQSGNDGAAERETL